MKPVTSLRQWRNMRARDREMRQFAEQLMGPVRERLSAAGGAGTSPPGGVRVDPDDLFQALVESARVWRGDRKLEVHRVPIPRDFKATGLWLKRHDQDDVIIEADAEPWHQAQIFGHELWHMRQEDGVTPEQLAEGVCSGLGSHTPDSQPAAARSRFDEDAEMEAELFGILVGKEMRELMNRDVILGETARNIADALGYRGKRN